MTKKVVKEKNIEKIEKKSAAQRAREQARRFKSEFNKAINTAFMAAFGFLIALVWKELIVEYVEKISANSPVQGKLISAAIVTLICVLGILFVTKVFREK